MNWNVVFNAANFNAGLQSMRGSFNGMFDNMSSGITKNISKFNAYQVALDYCIEAGKKLINESKELVAISTKYDIPISKMGKLQVLANASGQSVGQLARGFRFLEMNMGKALLKPGGPQYQAFAELGITQDEITVAAGNTAYAMDLVREKVMSIGDEERRNAFLQEIYGANWQNMLVIIEANATALKDAESSGYEYSSSMTESLTGVAAVMEEIAQDVKPIIMPIVQLIAMVVTLFGALIEGLKLMIQLAGGTLLVAFHEILGTVQAVVGALIKGAGILVKMVGGGDGVEAFGDGVIDAGMKNYKSAEDEGDKMGDKIMKSKREIQKSSDRFARQGDAFRESVGLADEGKYIKDKTKEMAELETAIRKNKQANIEQAQSQNKLRESVRLGYITQADYNEYAKQQIVIDKEADELRENKIRLQEQLDRAAAKPTKKQLEEAAEAKKRTQEERKIEIQELKQGREQGVKAYMANTPLVAEMETYHEIIKAQRELENLEENRADLIKNNSFTKQADADMKNQIANQQIELAAKEKAHEIFLRKKKREQDDSEKGRKDTSIKSMEEREQQFMTRQGMTAMDKASVSVENAIQKMQRDEEQMNKILNDDMRSQSEKLGARKTFEESTMGAQKEFDKLSLMQFQYSASDAAKKGMGGGMDVRENTLTVAKSSLDYLKRSYELQLKQFGLSPDQFGNVPQQLTGPFRGGGGR